MQARGCCWVDGDVKNTVPHGDTVFLLEGHEN